MFATPQTKTPPKVDAAMQYLHYARSLEQPQAGPFGGAPTESARPLSKMEAEVYDSALSTLLEYFNTEGFGEPKDTSARCNPDDPKAPEHINA